MTAVTVTAHNAVDTVDAINAAFAAGTVTTVNGRKLKAETWTARVATSWQNGTVSVTVEGRTARIGTVYVKVGKTLNMS